MDYKKSSICIKDWMLLVAFFAVSVLFGKLELLYSHKNSDYLDKAVMGIALFFCVMCITVIIYGIYKVIKKEYTMEKVWLFSGIFMLVQSVGVFQFEILLNYYRIRLNNVLFYNIMFSQIFFIIYVIFLLYYVIKRKNHNPQNGLTKINIMVLLLYLLIPFIRSVSFFIFKHINVIRDSNAKNILKLMIVNNTELIDNYTKILYPILIYGMICVAGIILLIEKMTYQKYIALAGTFILFEYFGVGYIDKVLNVFDKTFYTSNINLVYEIMLRNSYLRFFIIPLALYFLKRTIQFFIRIIDKKPKENV